MKFETKTPIEEDKEKLKKIKYSRFTKGIFIDLYRNIEFYDRILEKGKDKPNDYEIKMNILDEEKRSKQAAQECRNMKPEKEEVIDGEFLERIANKEKFQREESLRELIDKQRVFRQMGFKVKVTKKRMAPAMDNIHYL